MAYKQSANTTGNGGSTFTGPASTGVSSGDIVVTICTYDAGGSILTQPTGFTALDSWNNTVDGQITNTAWKKAGSSEPATYDWTNNTGSALDWVIEIVVLSGRSGAAPTKSAVDFVNTAVTSPQTIGFLTLTAVAGDDLVLASAPDVASGSAVYTWTAPTGYTLRQNTTFAASNAFMGTKDAASAGATGTVNGTLSWDVAANAGWGAVQYAFAVAVVTSTPNKIVNVRQAVKRASYW